MNNNDLNKQEKSMTNNKITPKTTNKTATNAKNTANIKNTDFKTTATNGELKTTATNGELKTTATNGELKTTATNSKNLENSASKNVETNSKNLENSASKKTVAKKTANSTNKAKKNLKAKEETSKKARKTADMATSQTKKSRHSLKENLARIKFQLAERKLLAKERKEEKKLSLQKMKIEKEKDKANRRVEMAKFHEQKKQEKEKLIQAKKQAHKRKVMEMKQAKSKHREEIEKRRQMLKNESKESKRNRIHQEKVACIEAKKEKKAIKAKQKQLKREQYLAIKAKKHENKHMRKTKKSENKHERKTANRGVGGWIAAVISLGVTTLALGSLLTVIFVDRAKTEGTLSSNYEKNFYDLVSYVDNLDVNLSKLRVSESSVERQKLLTDVVVQSELAEKNIEQLPLTHETKQGTAGFINVMGDYARTLMNKLASGSNLTNKEARDLEQIYTTNLKLKGALQELSGKMHGKYKFKELLKQNENDIMIETFKELETQSVDFPRLIYDGPFSDALETVKAKGLEKFNEITREYAEKLMADYFEDYKLSNIDYVGDAEGKSFNCYNFEAKTSDGKTLFAQLSKRGGKLIMFDMYEDCHNKNINKDMAVEIAQKFLKKLNIDNMKAVWINENEQVANINFVGESNGKIIYPDMIKIKVCEEKGKVVGFEGMSYYLNHTERNIKAAKIGLNSARDKVSRKIDINTGRSVVIAKNGGKEILAYEFMGQYDGSTYYIYIDANTGNETEIFKVINSTEGMLLM